MAAASVASPSPSSPISSSRASTLTCSCSNSRHWVVKRVEAARAFSAKVRTVSGPVCVRRSAASQSFARMESSSASATTTAEVRASSEIRSLASPKPRLALGAVSGLHLKSRHSILVTNSQILEYVSSGLGPVMCGLMLGDRLGGFLLSTISQETTFRDIPANRNWILLTLGCVYPVALLNGCNPFVQLLKAKALERFGKPSLAINDRGLCLVTFFQ